MGELSDLALLGIGAVALFVVYLLRVIWGLRSGALTPKSTARKQRKNRPKRRRGGPSKAKIRVVVDGSNVMFWGGDPSHLVLKHVIASLKSKGFSPYVIFDANVGYKLGDRYLDDAPMARLIGLPADQVLVVEKGVAADEWILKVATEQNVRVVSNDRFRDWKIRYPIVGKKNRIIRGAWKSGNVIWQSI